jgi:2-haloacid dehalogenase
MTATIDGIQALTFDIGGTVFDWLTAVERKLKRIASYPNSGIYAAAFARAWRGRFLECYEAVYRGDRAWLDAREICEVVLQDLLTESPGLTLDETETEYLLASWHEMPAWPEAPKAIARLRERFVVAPFTILTWRMAAGSSKVSGIVWDGILSCDLLGVYKPDPKSYARVARVLGCRTEEIMMVAAHPSDLRAAKTAGYRTAYVLPKLEDPGEDYRDTGFAEEFTLVAKDFGDLADRLLESRKGVSREP